MTVLLAIRPGADTGSSTRPSRGPIATARPWRRPPLAAAIFVTGALIFSLYSLRLHASFGTNSFDLGIFGQGLKGYAEGRGPISEIKGPGYSLLGDHFSPITAVLAPIYLLVPHIEVLLVAQAILLALGVWPIVSWAQRALGTAAALGVGIIYMSSFGLASAVAYDFHEVAFAVPLISFSLCALAQQRYGTSAGWALPLVLVKEDLGLTVAAVGAVMLLRRQRGPGLLLVVAGTGATAVETLVLVPMVNTAGAYDYSNQVSGSALAALLHPGPGVIAAKASSLVATFMVGCFVGTRSTIALVAVPTLLWRYLGSNPGYWGTANQYSAILMPIVVIAVVEVLIRHRADVPGGGHKFVKRTLITAVVVALLTAATFPLAQMFRPGFWQCDARGLVLDAAVEKIPSGSTVSASNRLVPHLVDRATVTVFVADVIQVSDPQWIVVDRLETTPDLPAQREAHIAEALRNGYSKVFDEEDVVVLRKNGIQVP